MESLMFISSQKDKNVYFFEALNQFQIPTWLKILDQTQM